jgi:hypothetical protein
MTCLGETHQVIVERTPLHPFGGLDGSHAGHQCCELRAGRFDDARQIGDGAHDGISHRAPPAWRKLSAVPTWSIPGVERPARSANVHATAWRTKSLIG